jgi:hypothetical protein
VATPTPCAEDPEKWFVEETNLRAVAEARGGCFACWNRVGCLKRAVEDEEKFGIWGGTTASERGWGSGGKPLGEQRDDVVREAASA